MPSAIESKPNKQDLVKAHKMAMPCNKVWCGSLKVFLPFETNWLPFTLALASEQFTQRTVKAIFVKI